MIENNDAWFKKRKEERKNEEQDYENKTATKVERYEQKEQKANKAR